MLRSGGARVRVTHAGLCGSDLHRLTAGSPFDILGHEISGIVTEIGPQLTGPGFVEVGDEVAVMPLLACGECAACRVGATNLCRKGEAIGRTHPGAFSGEVTVPAGNVRGLPRGVDLELGALADVIAVCVHAINQADAVAGERCLVIGDGAVGVAMALLLQQSQALVTLTGKHPGNLALAEMLSDGFIITGEPDDLRGEYTHVFEMVGRDQPDTLNLAVRLVRFKGQVTVLGVYPSGFRQQLAARDLFIKEGALVGSNSYDKSEFAIALRVLASAPEVYRGLITHRFPLAQHALGVDVLRNKAVCTVKVMFEVGDVQ